MHKTLIIATIFIALAAPAFADDIEAPSTLDAIPAAPNSVSLSPRERPSQSVDNWSLQSATMQRSYDISVGLPLSYAVGPEKNYPAIIALDGSRMFGMAELSGMLASRTDLSISGWKQLSSGAIILNLRQFPAPLGFTER